MCKSGDKCAMCGEGRYYISQSYPSIGGKYQVRTLRCNKCKKTHGAREVVLAENVRRRA